MSITGENIVGLGGKNYSIINGVSGRNLTVDRAQTISDNARVKIIEDPEATTATSARGQIQLIHMQGDVNTSTTPDQCTVSGYFRVKGVPATITLPLNLDTLFTAPGS